MGIQVIADQQSLIAVYFFKCLTAFTFFTNGLQHIYSSANIVLDIIKLFKITSGEIPFQFFNKYLQQDLG